ncbi:serine hydrolase [Propionibacteriaceae bacterium Y1923]|uniref:serine hydrolase domain-containing protein n=1 Tax=Aestuariimicrobium sp. Y1814 TaxID=3418742 RepID=UPI003C227412
MMRHTMRAGAALAVSVALTVGLVGPAAAEDYTKVHKGYASSGTVLKDSTPERAGLNPEPIRAAKAALDGYTVPQANGYPLYPGYAAVMGHNGSIVSREVGGHALLYADATNLLPESERIAVTDETIFDLASVSKLFTSLVAVQLVEENKLTLDEPVATYLPAFAANGKQEITVKQLLTHTSGLVSWLPLWSMVDNDARIAAVMNATPTATPGTKYEYSDLNLITLGLIVEQLRGMPLDEVVAQRVTQPLGMVDTGYNPTDQQRTAATEFQSVPNRGIVWGEVHDENAWSFGGVAGHAGVFSTTKDLSILSQALLNGGTYQGKRILKESSVDLLITDFNEAFPGNDHGLGFEIDQRWYMAGLSGPKTAGHTGYTGTSLVIDFSSRSFAILLTNRVHPSRNAGSVNGPRRVWAQGLALAMPVRPTQGNTAWRTGITDRTTSTLDLPVGTQAGEGKLSFDLFVDTEDQWDPFTLQLSTDGGQTWAALPYRLKDRDFKEQTITGGLALSGLRRWMKAEAQVPAGENLVIRWKHTTDNLYTGRGVYVDNIKLRGGGVNLSPEKDPSLLVAVNWTPSSN